MRIALRTSGGRGEYELAGSQGAIGVSDLFGRQMHFELTPDLDLNGHGAARHVQGKPRIRMEDTARHRHPYRILAFVLLLPLPKRELRATSDQTDFVFDHGYAITDIDIDIASVDASSVTLRPRTLWLSNALGLVRGLDFQTRMALIQRLWDVAREEESPLGRLAAAHEVAVSTGDHRDIEAAAKDLREAIGDSGDVLPILSSRLGADVTETAVGPSVDEVPEEPVDDETDPDEAARQAVAEWRKVAVRGAQGRAFSAQVRSEYSDRCAISGDALPKLERTASAGVDAAHILPWARYELNTLQNGICLNKLWHWAFDAGVIRIDFDDPAGQYAVSIPEHVRNDAAAKGMDLGYFQKHEGIVLEERLPRNPDHWPSPRYLERLNEEMFGAH